MSEIKLWLAAENERLEAELATANAKIEAVRVIHRLDVYVKRRSDGQRYCGADWEAYPCSTIRALESATPKPTDDSEGTQWCRACGTCFPCVTRVELDALLDEVGEPK